MKRLILSIWLLGIPLMSTAQIVNIESQRIITDTIGWAGALGLNASLVKNTTQLTNINTKAHIQWRPTKKSLYLVLGEYGLIKGNQTEYQNHSFGHIRYTRSLGRQVALEGFVQGQFNKLRHIEFRGLIGAGPRFKLFLNDTYKVYFASLYMHEREFGIDGEDFVGERLSTYLSISLRPTDSFKIINTTYYQPRLNAWNDYRLSGEAKLLWKISQRLNFVSAFYLNYDSVPIGEAALLNYKLTNGLSLSLTKKK